MRLQIFMALFLSIACLVAMNSCKKCTTCTARDSATNEIKLQEKSCSKGPLLDEWKESFIKSYPTPQYDTSCD